MKKNIFIIILSFIVVGLLGFIVYDNFFASNSKQGKVEKCKCVVKKDTKTAEERYKDYLDNLKVSINRTYIDNGGENTYSLPIINTSRVENTMLSEVYNIKIDKNLELTIDSDSLNNYKIADNVLSYYIIHTGNGGFSSLYYITTEGKVFIADVENAIYNKTTIQTKEIDVKNIVEIKEGSSTAGFPMFVDIDGNIIKE